MQSLLFMCCQDVSSFGNTPVKMCHLSAGSSDLYMSLVHVCMLCSMVYCSHAKFTVGFQDRTYLGRSNFYMLFAFDMPNLYNYLKVSWFLSLIGAIHQYCGSRRKTLSDLSSQPVPAHPVWAINTQIQSQFGLDEE